MGKGAGQFMKTLFGLDGGIIGHEYFRIKCTPTHLNNLVWLESRVLTGNPVYLDEVELRQGSLSMVRTDCR